MERDARNMWGAQVDDARNPPPHAHAHVFRKIIIPAHLKYEVSEKLVSAKVVNEKVVSEKVVSEC
jgi:hypothetical protein